MSEEFFSVWIDYNGDCDFDDAGELVYTSAGTSSTVTGLIAIPADLQRMTTMRISMRYNSASTRPCGSFADGEVEDYTINIIPGDGGGTPVGYCEAGVENADSEHIIRVQLGSIDNASNTSAASGYADYTAQVAEVALGQTHTMTVTPSASWEASKLSVWVDWNQDGDFDDSNKATVVNGSGPYEVSLNVPDGAKKGETRMRIRLSYSNGLSTPCGMGWTGEVEDYTVNVKEAGSITQEAESGSKVVVEASAYPNPSPDGKYTIEIPANGRAQQMTVRIFSMQGNLIKNKTVEGNRATVSLQDLNKGLYQMQITSGGDVYHKKLVYR